MWGLIGREVQINERRIGNGYGCRGAAVRFQAALDRRPALDVDQLYEPPSPHLGVCIQFSFRDDRRDCHHYGISVFTREKGNAVDARDSAIADLHLLDAVYHFSCLVSGAGVGGMEQGLENPAFRDAYRDPDQRPPEARLADLGDRGVTRILWSQGGDLYARQWRRLSRDGSGRQFHRRKQRIGSGPDHDDPTDVVSPLTGTKPVDTERPGRK